MLIIACNVNDLFRATSLLSTAIVSLSLVINMFLFVNKIEIDKTIRNLKRMSASWV